MVASWPGASALQGGQHDALDTGRISIPFPEWIAHEEHEQIPWEVQVSRPVLGSHQRPLVNLDVRVSGKAIAKRGVAHDLILLARLADSDGYWFEDYGLRRMQFEQPLPKRTYAHFLIEVWVLPGEYTLGLILYDRVTGEHNVARRSLKVPPIKNDPLPDAYRNLPRVEFLRQAEELERSFRPEVQTKLWLPVETRRPVRVEVLVNFTPSEQYAGSRQLGWSNVAILLATLEVLSQMEIPNGSLHITGLDLFRREVIFEQNNVRQVDWLRLREALGQIVPGSISVRALEGRNQNAAFFRDVLERRLADRTPDAVTRPMSVEDRPAAVVNQEPFRVFIVASSAVLFSHGADLKPVPPMEGCNCRVYYLQFQIWPSNLWDHLRKVMQPLEPRRFELRTPLDLRKALAAILEEMGRL